MLKQLCTLLIITVLFGSTACGNNNTVPSQLDSSTQQSASPSAEQDEYDADVQHSQDSEDLSEDASAKLFGEIKIVPESYNSSASRQGTVETFEYTSGSYQKTA